MNKFKKHINEEIVVSRWFVYILSLGCLLGAIT